MSEKLDPVMPKLVQLLLMLGSSSDGECLNAARATLRLLIGIDADMHDLVDRLQKHQSSPPPRCRRSTTRALRMVIPKAPSKVAAAR